MKSTYGWVHSQISLSKEPLIANQLPTLNTWKTVGPRTRSLWLKWSQLRSRHCSKCSSRFGTMSTPKSGSINSHSSRSKLRTRQRLSTTTHSKASKTPRPSSSATQSWRASSLQAWRATRKKSTLRMRSSQQCSRCSEPSSTSWKTGRSKTSRRKLACFDYIIYGVYWWRVESYFRQSAKGNIRIFVRNPDRYEGPECWKLGRLIWPFGCLWGLDGDCLDRCGFRIRWLLLRRGWWD